MTEEKDLDKFVSFAKRRGVIWPDSEIYGGAASTYDYGPVGVEMKNKLKNAWWNSLVHLREDVVGIDSAIINNPKVWEASGHTQNFADPLVEDTVTHKRYRLDELDDPTKSPEGNPLSKPKKFNLLFKTFIGPVEDETSVAYLRGETCQGIFLNFNNVLDTSRQKIPFGIAQIGKAFRNEITPGNLTFRTLEFEQMEMEFFVKEKEADKWFDYWVHERMQWYIDLGIDEGRLRLRKHPKEDLAHYSKATTDIEYLFPWGWGELEGIANRSNYDLTQHQKHSGKDMSVFDETTKERFIPWVIEPSGGVDRALLAFLLDAFVVNEKGRKGQGPEETVLMINPELSAYDAAVLPLIKKDELVKKSGEILEILRKQNKHIFYDDSGSIGRRYRRQDEIGTPICYTIDFQTLEDGTVTMRDRDSMSQDRIKL
jgi:glycyl-tRNA synthetase